MESAGLEITNLILPDTIQENKSFNSMSNQFVEINSKVKPKVLFFDVNETLLDLTAMKAEVGKALNGRTDLLSMWFTTMLQYSLVITASGQYENFSNIGGAALQMVAANNGISISEKDARTIIVQALHSLPAHQEVKSALTLLKEEGYKLVAFSNSSKLDLNKQFKFAELTDFFDNQLSVEEIQKFKPFTDTYSWAAREMQVKPAECMLVAAHGWDVAGALWAGWRAAFVSRPGQQLFPLAPKCEIVESDLKKIADLLITYK